VHLFPVSDIHLDWELPVRLAARPDEAGTVLVLAGDITCIRRWRKAPNGDVARHTLAFLEDVSQRFNHVVAVLGNHDFYDGEWTQTIADARTLFAQFPNVTLLENDILRLGDVSFVGATLWTDCKDPMAGMLWKRMTDSSDIRVNEGGAYRRLRVPDVIKRHLASRRFCLDALQAEKAAGQKTVWVTHHLPTFRSMHPHYEGNLLNCFYASELGNDIVDAAPDLILHGHTHQACDHRIGATRIVCNPRGYPGQRTVFNEFLSIEVPGSIPAPDVGLDSCQNQPESTCTLRQPSM